MLNKRGQGLSLNLVVVGIIAVLVLVVIAFIFSSQAGEVNRQLSSCSSKLPGGQCTLQSDCTGPFVSDDQCVETVGPGAVCCGSVGN